jgi:hypothetical protein
MAGVFELLRPQKKAVVHCASRMNPEAMELETAKEILAEIFRVRLSDVDEMIQNRFEAAGSEDVVSKEKRAVAAGVLPGIGAYFQNCHQRFALASHPARAKRYCRNISAISR